jgi:hypothetical protein
LAIFRNRFPPRQEVLQVYTIISVPINIWAMIAVLRVVPSWILSMSIWEMIGVMAYPLAFALIESLFIFAILWILAVILPSSVYRARFVSQSTIIALLAATWGIIMQLWGQQLRLWTANRFVGIIILGVLIIVLSFLNAHSEKSQKTLTMIAERLTILGIFYFIIDIFFLIIVIVNNLL